MTRLILFSLLLAPFAGTGGLAGDLDGARSAFVRAHAGSPVEWMTWGEDAFERAREENKPVFLVIGTFASELGRSMREQSFGQEETAKLLNDHFVCVLVDRDEFPGLAALNQAWLRAVKQLRGWPLNLWLTPELKTFEGATYLPPSDEWGNLGFGSVVRQVISAWESDPDAVRQRADAGERTLQSDQPEALGAPLEPADLEQLVAECAADWMAIHEAGDGGFGEPPRYPQPELLRFLLRSNQGGQVEAALSTLRAMATGGIRDPLDGGFFRYARDAQWLLPNGQKSLSDQARLALAFLDAAEQTGEAFFGEVARETLLYALTLKEDGSGYVATEDWTFGSILPAFFWSADEIRSVLGRREGDSFCLAYGLTNDGNLPADAYLGVDTAGKNIIHGWADSEGFAAARERLLNHRDERVRPMRDSSAPGGTHGLLLSALARGGKELDDVRFVTAAGELAAFIQRELIMPAEVLRAGPGLETEASARDYALVADGLLTYAAISGDEDARDSGWSLAEAVLARFGDPATGRFHATGTAGGPGIWARVHLPLPDTADLPGAEPALIEAWARHGPGDMPGLGIDPYVSGVVDAMETGIDRPKGDQLLALRAYLDSSRRR